jgi:RNA polymerase sigma factor (sigma-70 family)
MDLMSASQTEEQIVADEIQLLGQIAAGDAGAPMAELYRRYGRRLFRFGMTELRNDWLAEELVHESFVQLWRSAEQFNPKQGTVGSYLFMIARDAARDIRERPSSLPLLTLEEAYEQLQFDDTEQILDGLILREALDALSPAHRQVLWLAYTEGLTQQQIAERLGLALGTVKSRMFHGMRALRAALEERGFGRSGDHLRSVITERVVGVNPVKDPGRSTVHASDDLWTGEGYYFPPSASSFPPGRSGEPPAEGRASWQTRPERDRYLVGELPGRVRAGKELSLIVSITTKQPETGLAVAMPSLAPGPQGVQVTIVVLLDAGLVTLAELQQTVVVPQKGDPQPLRFALRARAVGLSRVRVTAWSGGTFLAGLQLEVSVEAEEPTADSQQRSAPVGALWADPGEVTLQVHFDGSRYTFQLLSQKYLFNPVMAESLTEEPGQAVERTVEMLRKIAADVSGYSPKLAARWVRETGIGLWQDLVPPSIQDQFWQLRDSITSFNIACDDDKVPWELLYPLTPRSDEGFLIEQFPVLRRVYDQCRSGQILLGDAQFVVPPGSPDNAREEVATIGQIVGQAAAAVITDLGDLLNLLDAGSTGLLHFACHNTFSLDTGGSSIKMVGGAFVPALLNSAVGRRCLATRSPLICINACRSAGVSAQYTQMMGWASQFMEAGAGAFVGTLWPVRSSQASLFAEAFYSALTAGASLGQASLTARQAAKDDADPTWLAYTTYGDPTARSVSRL